MRQSTYRECQPIRSLALPVVLCASCLLNACSVRGWEPAPVESRGGAAAQPATRAQVFTPGYYKVRSGDTLYGIAWEAAQDFRSLARWNNIRPPYTIFPGQLIRLKPPPAPRVARARSVDKPAKPAPRAAPARTPRQAKATRPASPPRQAKHQKPPPRAAPGRPVEPTRQAKPAAVASGPLRWNWPAQGKLVARFRKGDPLKRGIKLSGATGSPVRSAAAGRVVYSGSGLRGYGRLIIVKHNDNYLSAYGHNRKLLTREGDQVTKGQQLAEMGNDSTGLPMLHFEIRRDGRPIDPLRILPKR